MKNEEIRMWRLLPEITIIDLIKNKKNKSVETFATNDHH